MWYYPIPGCVLLGVYESLISSDWFTLPFPLLPALHISPSLCSPSPTPCHTPVPQGICLGSARLISREEKANWEPVLAVNLAREGEKPAVATLHPTAQWVQQAPSTLEISYLHQHVQKHKHTQVLNKVVCAQVFPAIKAHPTSLQLAKPVLTWECQWALMLHLSPHIISQHAYTCRKSTGLSLKR